MRAVENDEVFDLIDPHTKLVKKSMKARQKFLLLDQKQDNLI